MSSIHNSEYGQKMLTQSAQKRLIRDITEMYRTPLEDQGIYYVHSDCDMTEGYAMIIGPEDTPYSNGVYLFKFVFPYNYPAVPPKVLMMTNNGYTRFHPNLYRSGKVCLSILNTWQGDSWTSCQNIRSVLLTLVTLFSKQSLLHEPGFHATNSKVPIYDKMILYENINSAICDILNGKSCDEEIMKRFEGQIKKHFTEKKQTIIEETEKMIDVIQDGSGKNTIIFHLGFYQNMKLKTDFSILTKKLKSLFNSLKIE